MYNKYIKEVYLRTILTCAVCTGGTITATKNSFVMYTGKNFNLSLNIEHYTVNKVHKAVLRKM